MKRSETTVAIAGTRGAGWTGSRSFLQAARTQAKGFRSAVRPSSLEVRQAAEQNRGSNGSMGRSSSRGSDEDGPGGQAADAGLGKWVTGRATAAPSPV
jgi:hypothetical protein